MDERREGGVIGPEPVENEQLGTERDRSEKGDSL